MSCPQASLDPANPSQSPANVLEQTTPETCGLTPFAFYERAERRWASSRMSLDFSTQGISGPSSVTWPKRGTMRSGACWERTTLERRTGGSGCGSWPTPAARDWKSGQASDVTLSRNSRPLNEIAVARGRSTRQTWPTPDASVMNLNQDPKTYWERIQRCKEKHINGNGAGTVLAQAVRQTFRTPRALDGEKGGPNQTDGGPSLSNQAAHMPTPTANRRSGLQSHGVNVVDGSLNPAWVEWLMSFPADWTDASHELPWACPSASTDCGRSVTPRCLSRWLQRGRYWLTLLGYLGGNDG
jgi:hypothetical protein